MGMSDETALIQAVAAHGRQQRAAAKAKARAPAKPKPAPVDSAKHQRTREGLRRVRAKKRAQVDELKRKPCADCGGTFHPFVMDFDHREGTAKTFNVSAGIPLGLSWNRIVEEAAKCDVVCSNCHRMRTFRRIEQSRLATPPVTPRDPTRCKRGHPRTEENTRIKRRNGENYRECRECERVRYGKKKAAEGVAYKPRKPVAIPVLPD